MHPEQKNKTIQDRKNFKVFLGGTPFNCTSMEIKTCFAKYGDIKKVYFPMDMKKNR
jgi:RNA recognition motif-containing protein